MQNQCAARSARSGFKTMVGSLRSGLAETKSLSEEAFAFRHFSHRQNRAIEALDSFARADLGRGPTLAVVVGFFDRFVRQPRRVVEADERLAEAGLNSAMTNLVAIEVILPKGQ